VCEFGFSDVDVRRLLSLSKIPRPLVWHSDCLDILDQRLLPNEIKYLKATSWLDCKNAIHNMTTRGAPIIGVCGAYGMALAALKEPDNLEEIALEMKMARPTASNLAWAVDKMMMCQPLDMQKTAEQIELDEHRRSFAIAKNGSILISNGMTVLTHCNTGSLAAGGFGTALGVLIWGVLVEKKHISVFNTETRPYLQGSRLTSFELMNSHISDTLISDMAAGFFMSQGKVDLVIVGADRIAKNGDFANKIGTLTLAVLAKEYNIPFFVAAPRSTFDLSIDTGSQIIVENRESTELTEIYGHQIAPDSVNVSNPAFDITLHDFVDGYITEYGVFDDIEGLLLSL